MSAEGYKPSSSNRGNTNKGHCRIQHGGCRRLSSWPGIAIDIPTWSCNSGSRKLSEGYILVHVDVTLPKCLHVPALELTGMSQQQICWQQEPNFWMPALDPSEGQTNKRTACRLQHVSFMLTERYKRVNPVDSIKTHSCMNAGILVTTLKYFHLSLSTSEADQYLIAFNMVHH